MVLTWTPSLGVDYWLFTATDPSLTAFNWTGLPNAHAYINATTPYYMCGLFNGTQYYFAANGRTNGGPGGPSSPTITTTNSPYPYNASTNWIAGSTISSANIYGVGYASLTTCGNTASISATGVFAAVGTGGAIYTSYDNGSTWSQVASSLTSATLNAVTGYATNLNNAVTPALRWMAVGDAGTVVFYQDSTGWVLANNLAGSTLGAANPGNKVLRSVMQVNGTFFAVGDAGTIISSPDAVNWTHRLNNNTQNLNGVTYGGGIYVAVGDSGTILTSGDGNTWAVPTTTPPVIPAGINLQKVASFVSSYGNIYVAVGDGGTIVTRTSNNYNNNVNWTAQTLPGAPKLVGITVESRGVQTNPAYGPVPAADPKLWFISTAQFVAVDAAGSAYTSVNGYDWSAPISTATPLSPLNALTSSGFGYVAAGNNGVTATAF